MASCLSSMSSGSAVALKKDFLPWGVAALPVPLLPEELAGFYVPATTARRKLSLESERCFTNSWSMAYPLASTLGFHASLVAAPLCVTLPPDAEVGEKTVSYSSLKTSSFLRKLSISARLSCAFRLSLVCILRSPLVATPRDMLPKELWIFSFLLESATRVFVLKCC